MVLLKVAYSISATLAASTVDDDHFFVFGKFIDVLRDCSQGDELSSQVGKFKLVGLPYVNKLKISAFILHFLKLLDGYFFHSKDFLLVTITNNSASKLVHLGEFATDQSIRLGKKVTISGKATSIASSAI